MQYADNCILIEASLSSVDVLNQLRKTFAKKTFEFECIKIRVFDLLSKNDEKIVETDQLISKIEQIDSTCSFPFQTKK